MPRQIEAERVTVPGASGEGNSVCRMLGAGAGPPRGNKNALKHGGSTTEAHAMKSRMARDTMAAIEP